MLSSAKAPGFYVSHYLVSNYTKASPLVALVLHTPKRSLSRLGEGSPLTVSANSAGPQEALGCSLTPLSFTQQ